MGDWAFAPDGYPLYGEVMYGDGARLDLVSCRDRFCDTATRTTIETTGFNFGRVHWLVAPDGGVLVAYSTDEPVGPPDPEAGYDGADFYGTQKVAWCSDPRCLDGPVVMTIDEGVTVGGGSIIEGTGVEIWFISRSRWLRRATGPDDEHLASREVTYGKAACLDAACTEFALTFLGPYEMGGASTSPLPNGLPDTVAPDGSRVDLRRTGDALVLERWIEAAGGTWAFTTLASFETGGFGWAHDASLAIGPNDLACTPPGG